MIGLTRRTALTGLAAGSLGGCLPAISWAKKPTALHDTVARKVRALTGGLPAQLSVLIPHGAGGNLAPIVAAFEQMTGVKITSVETQVDDMNSVLALDALSGIPTHDLALAATFGLADLVSTKVVLPLTDYARTHEPAGFRDGIIYGAGDQIDGDIYGFQTDGDAYMMFYNKAMVQNPSDQARYADQFGTALQVPQTWGELDRQLAYFNRPDEGQYGGLLFRTQGYLVWEWWSRLHAKGVWPFAPDMTPQVASDAGVAALEDMISVADHLHPDVGNLGLFDNWQRFSRGDIFCNIGWGGSQKHFNQTGNKMKDNLLFGPTPGGIVDGDLLTIPYFNWGWNYVVLSGTNLPEIAYLFALFASSPDMTTLAVRQADGFFDPFREEHYKDAGIKSAYSAEFLKIHHASLVNAIPDLYLEAQGEYRRVLSHWLLRALNGETSPKAALGNVAQRWDFITHSVGTKKQSARWMRLREKYPTQIQSALKDIG